MGLQTAQARVWQGQFGRDYTNRNTFGPEELDSLWLRNYGVSRSEINRAFLGQVPKNSKILEVGCNVGNQLLLLQNQGYTRLSGIELQAYAATAAKSRLNGVEICQGSASGLPYEDNSFELVFTSGVLIHIAPEDLPQALREVHRCAKRYIWGAEYFCPETTCVEYRGHKRLLWKMDYVKLYLSLFPDIRLVKEKRLKYLGNENVDTVFLFEKGTGG